MEQVFDLCDVHTLGNLTGRPQIWVALVFASDAGESLPEGAYVDRTVVRKYVPGIAEAGKRQIEAGAQPGGHGLRQAPAQRVFN